MMIRNGPASPWASGEKPSLAASSDHRAARSAPPEAEAPSVVVTRYLSWAWPVTMCGDQVLLAVGAEVAAIALPARLTDAVVAVLDSWCCPLPVLSDPNAPAYRVLLAGDPFGVPLPWPADVHPAGASVSLPPSTTPHGPVTWQRSPAGPELWTCREIDIFAAVRAVQRTAASSERAMR